MKKLLLLLSFLLFTCITTAQSIGEVLIQGNIEVPDDGDAGGITIYNKNSGKGSVSLEDGKFSIAAKLHDSLYFSALQYRDLLVVVDEKIIKTRSLYVEITENVNELAEVVIKPHDLSGNLTADLKKIPITHLDLPTWSAAEISAMDFSFSPDAQSGVANPAMGGGSGKYGFQPKKIIGGLVELLTPRSGSRPVDPFKKKASYMMLERELTARFDSQFFLEVLEIEQEKVPAFIAFLNEQGVAQVLLKKEYELQLLDLMVLQSAKFLKE